MATACPHDAPARPAGMNPIWRQDRRTGFVSLAMWAGTEIKVYSLLTPAENLQSLSAMVLMFLLVVAWPTWRVDSYLQWRTPIIAFLRTYLIALPFNFSTAVFDAIAPSAATGPSVVANTVANIFNLFMAIRIALLTFTSLGWRLPLRLHMLMQAINVSIFIRYGLGPYCESKLLCSPELQQTAAAVHRLMALGTRLFMNVRASVPEGIDAQRSSFVLFCWFILGWVLPTVLLMSASDGDQQQQQQPPWVHWRQWPGRWLLRAGVGSLRRVGGLAEAWLRMLQQPKLQPTGSAADAGDASPDAFDQEQSDEARQLLYTAARWVLQWWVMLLVAWRLACAAADTLQ